MQRLALPLGLGLTLAALTAIAEEKAHEHGHAQLNVAIEDEGIELELIAPGADIVGFEHAPGSDEDRAAVAAAVTKFQAGLFSFPKAAGCALEATGVYSALLPDGKPVHAGEHHHDADHKDEHPHDDKHDDHKDEHAHDDKHGDHKDEHAHDDKHDDHKDEHAHDDKHDHDKHADEDGHAEFKVHFHYECKDTTSLTGLETSYFEMFPNAKELDVAALTATGQVAAELTPQSAGLKF